MPAITLACVSTALAARMMRGSMLEVLRADYMRTARAKGLTERDVVVKHGLRNAMLPVVTLIGIDFGTVIGAAVLTETTFSWPGLGSEIANSVTQRDLPVVLGLTLVVVIAFALINLLVDVSYAWFDPRIRLGKGGHGMTLVEPGTPTTVTGVPEVAAPEDLGEARPLRADVWRRFKRNQPRHGGSGVPHPARARRASSPR